jgi:squalene-hopene/tetraprenyl-beta-curcumene cyclase
MSIYNTSICLAALVRNADAKDRLLMDAAQRFLVDGQTQNSPGKTADGGYGYDAGGKGKADLDNTVFTLEALKLYRDMQKSEDLPAGKQLNWNAAIDFVSRCQQLPATNKQSWVSKDAAEKGGFVYQPSPESGDNSGGPPRSYGTMTYAGLLSFIYAEVKPEDQRVKAAKEWIERRYTLEENPGRGAEGLYYYYHLMAKGLTAAGIKSLKTADGRTVDWKAELTSKLLSLQKPDGSWASGNGRWMEKDPSLVTSYCLLALAYLAEEK